MPVPELLSQHIFAYLVVFTRVGAVLMVAPALGDRMVPVRVRLLLALMIALVGSLAIFPTVPPLPNQALSLAGIVVGEAMVGVAIGMLVRVAFSALNVAGTVIAFQTSLAYAMNFDPTQGAQGSVIGSLLAILGTTLIFATNLHHLLIAGAIDSYALFPLGGALPFGDLSSFAVSTVGKAFMIGIQMSAPFIVYGLVFYLAIGVLSKLIPQVQIFFVSMPANIIVGFILLGLLLSTLMMWFVQYYEGYLVTLLGKGG